MHSAAPRFAGDQWEDNHRQKRLSVSRSQPLATGGQQGVPRPGMDITPASQLSAARNLDKITGIRQSTLRAGACKGPLMLKGKAEGGPKRGQWAAGSRVLWRRVWSGPQGEIDTPACKGERKPKSAQINVRSAEKKPQLTTAA